MERFNKPLLSDGSRSGTTVGEAALRLLRLRIDLNVNYGAIDEVRKIVNDLLPATARRLPSLKITRAYFTHLAGSEVGPFKVEIVHLCVSGCVAFRAAPTAFNQALQKLHEATECPICKEPRYFDATRKNPRSVGASFARMNNVCTLTFRACSTFISFPWRRSFGRCLLVQIRASTCRGHAMLTT
jgi:hypothetical protein